MKILVCGGAGYIGSHTTLELLDKGYEVIVFDNLETGYKQAVSKDVKLYVGDLRNPEDINKVFNEHKIDAVIHFAAYSLAGVSMKEPLEYFENNLGGTLNLLKSMNKYDVRYIVFSSTAATYGEPENIPILETDKTFPSNTYGESKLCVEKMFKWCDTAYGLKYTALRYFNAAGAHISGKIGESHNPETHLIPIVLKAAINQEKVMIFGDDYDTPDGTCIRDYLHVTDLADAHILALENMMKTNTSTIYNLGNGKGFSNKQVVDIARKVTGIDIKSEIAGRREGDPSTLIASS